ncbi:hypothetical protein [Actinobacillus pleuropneumoniae]|uniref:hypothetical protein n=1 Tax=Actinobacillus pleuropneumoniae TaxID=715 RepID=UPI003F7BC7E1
MFKKIWNFAKREFTYAYWIMNIFTILMFFYVFIIHFNLLFKNEFNIEYKSYYNVSMTISDAKIVGRLNKFITTKKFNESCYIKTCGFPKEGEFYLSKITFIKIYNKYFLLSSCVFNKNNKCFYNMTNNDIEKEKQKIIYHAKDEIKWALITIIGIISVSFLQTFILSEAKKRGINLIS